jgi:predicted phage baseplate assembly protein
MPLTEPNLDDRTFEEIYSDLRLRIPRYTKEWTNFNESDSGVTLLQLFAWLSEMMLYRMNQVPLKNYIKFLKLLGTELEPARPALARLTFTPVANSAAKDPPAIPPGAQFSAQAADGGLPLVFETERALDLIQPLLDTVGVFDGAGFANASDANAAPGTTFQPFGWSADSGNALYLGFVPPEPLPAAGSARLFPQEMTFALFLPPAATAGKPVRASAGAQPPVAPVTLAWEYRPAQNEPWQPLSVFEDTTAAFTREGYVRVEGPRSVQPSLELSLNAKPRFYVRVRIDGGVTYPAGTSPVIDFIRPNTVDAKNVQTFRDETLGTSDGQPNEVFSLRHVPVVPESVSVRTVMPDDSSQDWTRVPDFLAATPDDRVYTLNPVEGTIRFGDGDRGLIPSPTANIVAAAYRAGGGSRGNAAVAGSIKNPMTLLTGVDKITNARDAVGGADEQTLDDLKLKTPALLRRRDRAVTPEDFESLVVELGGIAAAVALPTVHPDFPGVSVPGAITVAIVPDNSDVPPKPSSDLIRAACAMLDEKRLLTTEVFVKGPEYQEVRVEARVSANPYASFDTVALAARSAINALLDPRKRGFGKDLFPTSLYAAVLDAHADIVGVLTLNIFVDGRRITALEPIAVPPDGLVYGGDHFISVQPASA